MNQLWQEMRLTTPDEMVGNEEAVATLKGIASGFVLIDGPMGCGKTSLALAYAKQRTGVQLEEDTVYQRRLDTIYAEHCHAADLDLTDVKKRKFFFGAHIPVLIIVDEAHELTAKKQQSRLKTIKHRPELTLIFCTTNPQALDPAIVDRCQKIHLGPLTSKKLPIFVERACRFRGIPHSPDIVPALCRANIFRPRPVQNVIDDLARGKTLLQAITDNA
jgi:replication-associated recombination protein RarA